MSLATFINLYGTEDQCAAALAKLRWHDGFACPKCGGRAHGHPVRADASQTNASACVARRTSRYRSRSSSRGPRDRYGAGTSAAASHGQGTAKSPDSRSATSDATTPAGAATLWRCGPSAPCRTRRAAACDRCRQRDQRIADARIRRCPHTCAGGSRASELPNLPLRSSTEWRPRKATAYPTARSPHAGDASPSSRSTHRECVPSLHGTPHDGAPQPPP